tara:strand:+ start:55 stop:630 length:576 start_codon:yes stop_codon:yes gene_type:complete
VALVIKGSSSGQVTVDVPASAGTNTLTLPAESGNILTNDTSGTILQVVSTTKTDTFSTTSTSMTDLTGMSVSITPVSTSNKILVTGNIFVSGSSASALVVFNLVRGSTNISISTGSGSVDSTTFCDTDGMHLNENSTYSQNLNFLDSPSSTASTTYKVQMRVTQGTGFINRRGLNDNVRAVSSITAMEIVA